MHLQTSRCSEVDRVAGPTSLVTKHSVASYGRVMRNECGRTAVRACVCAGVRAGMDAPGAGEWRCPLKAALNGVRKA